MIVGHIGGSSAPYQINKSLRLRASASAYLSRTPGVAGNRKTWTWSGWVKRGSLGALQSLFATSYATGASTNGAELRFDTTDKLTFVMVNIPGGLGTCVLTTTGVFKDPSAHYHVVVGYDTTQNTPSNRMRLFVNGVQIVAFDTATYPPLDNASGTVNNTQLHEIGRITIDGAPSRYFDGYPSEINFVDGQSLTPASFGEFNSDGVWVPKKYTGTYGTNGFYLPFSDGSSLATLTADQSGNGNNWTANNVSLTAGATYGWMEDTPTNNFCTLSPLPVGRNSTTILANANLRMTRSSTGDCDAGASIAVSGGKWYFEATRASAASLCLVGICDPTRVVTERYSYRDDGVKSSVINGTTTNAAYGSLYSTNAVVGVAFDADAGTLEFFNDNASQGVAFTGIPSSVAWSPYGYVNPESGGTEALEFNFGQRPFAYTPPAGFKALCTKNLPAPTITKPSEHFQTVLATGANIKSQMDALFSGNVFEWIKDRANSNNHQLMDVSRGLTAVLQSNTTAAETVYSAPAGTSVGWGWKAGGAPVANNAGSIPSQVSANVQAGFSIVTYTGTGANTTVGHGLGVAPSMLITKSRNGVDQWWVYSNKLAITQYLQLNLTNAAQISTTLWNSTSPTSSVFSLGANNANTNAATYVAYLFAEVAGYSKFGSYTGNGSANGTFVYCGFRPKFVLIKRIDSTGNWVLLDSSRAGYNVDNDPLYANLTNAEATTDLLDITATGFKLRSTNVEVNAAGGTYLFMVIAEQPFNTPSNAR